MKKTVLITGASAGIGKETAKQLLKEGYTVYAVARRTDKMQDLEALGAIALAMDITKEADVVRVVQTITEKSGGVDVLVNNAGFGSYGAMEDTTIDDARYQFEVNLFGLARLTQLVLPYMREKKAGTIINISSVGGKIYTPLGAWYHATKHALEGWSDCLRLEVAQFGINVVIVEPGGIKTEFVEVLTEPLLQRSGNSAYAKMANSVAKETEEMYGPKGKASDPSVISELISRIIKTKNPKTRYAKGYMSWLVLFLRRWVSDRMFDRIILSQMKK